MEDYENAEIYASESLNEYNVLLDYNNTSIINPSSSYRFPAFTTNESLANPEIVFYAEGILGLATAPVRGVQYVDTNLYKQYQPNDLRKTLLFLEAGPNKARYVGTYTGVQRSFWGIATNEIYFILAECSVRTGDYVAGMAALNTVLRKRHVSGSFSDLTAVNAEDALLKVLSERRKEFPFTAQLRWEDLRRLNNDSRFAKTLTRKYNGTIYSLPPNDNRYVFPIPQSEIDLAHLIQNPR
jgi:hypothetical protein